ncbi:hypothetical protein ACRTC3_11700 [Photobacterium damselae]|uniref:hypothetical protein n=1 Tax=Photobacterium damselae TaxID=38293 RepID=UPI003D7D3F15
MKWFELEYSPLYLAGSIIMAACIFGLFIDNETPATTSAYQATVVLPCEHQDGCSFTGMLDKNKQTYTLTQKDGSAISFTQYLSISPK